MSDLLPYSNQPILDAIVAATRIENDYGGQSTQAIIIDVKKFIEVFNNHRDHALCTSLRAPQPSDRAAVIEEPRTITAQDEEYARDLLDDLKSDDASPVAIAAQWFCKARYERALAASPPAQASPSPDGWRDIEIKEDQK